MNDGKCGELRGCGMWNAGEMWADIAGNGADMRINAEI